MRTHEEDTIMGGVGVSRVAGKTGMGDQPNPEERSLGPCNACGNKKLPRIHAGMSQIRTNDASSRGSM
jgi:hypothetical protein